MMANKYIDLTLDRAVALANEDPQAKALLQEMAGRVVSVREEHQFFAEWCDRADKLYFTDDFTEGGADLWPTDESALTPGRTHISINTPATYVDVPAALQAVKPIENMLPTDDTDEAREVANAWERVYTQWKDEEKFELKFHKVAVVKALYGRTAGRIVWDEDEDDENERGHPRLDIIQQPRDLYLGYKSDDYDALEWVAYVQRYDPLSLAERFNVNVGRMKDRDGNYVPAAITGILPSAVGFDSMATIPERDWQGFTKSRIEVWDYWYRKVNWVGKGKNKRAQMVVCNAVFAGNVLVQGPTEYPEYKGELPYKVVFNTFIPGVPMGRPELWDIEHIIREKYEKVSAAGQMIANAVAGDYWQLVGPEAPLRVPAGLKPRRNQLVAPGPGNRIETITPFVAQFQLEQYLGRLDREAATISGLNDLLLGLAPAQVLSSSKAINALIANYESRISMRRKLLYTWRKDVWELAERVWKEKDADVRGIIEAGGGVLEIIDPSLSPRDDMETATRASNLMNARVWSQARAMDATGVDDPEREQARIRAERTDATMFPESVQVMAQLMSVLQQLGLQAPQAQAQAQAQLGSGTEDLRRALGAATPEGTNAQQGPEVQGLTPPIPGAPPEAGGPPDAFAQAPEAGQQNTFVEGLIQGGEAKGRIRTQRQLGRR